MISQMLVTAGVIALYLTGIARCIGSEVTEKIFADVMEINCATTAYPACKP